MTNLDPWDHALLEALDGIHAEPAVTLERLSESAGLPPALLEALTRENLLIPVSVTPELLYRPSDAIALAAGLEMVSAGLPLAELLELARAMSEAMAPIAEKAVDAFERYIRDSVTGTASSEAEAADRLVTAFQTMLPAAGNLVGHHFQRLVAAQARARINPS